MCKIVIILFNMYCRILLLYIMAFTVESAVIMTIKIMRQENYDCALRGELVL